MLSLHNKCRKGYNVAPLRSPRGSLRYAIEIVYVIGTRKRKRSYRGARVHSESVFWANIMVSVGHQKDITLCQVCQMSPGSLRSG